MCWATCSRTRRPSSWPKPRARGASRRSRHRSAAGALEAWSEADPLNDRERQVLRLAGEGRSAGEIAAALHLSQGTVRNYLSGAIGKLGVGNRIEAYRLARRKAGCEPLRSARRACSGWACSVSSPAPGRLRPAACPHEAYVWQRQWTSGTGGDLAGGAGTSPAGACWPLHSDRRGVLQPIAVDLAVLAAAWRPVTAVLRLDGADPAVDAAGAAAQLADLVQRWRAAGVDLAGVGIDHDCATARLDGYADLLRSLRTRLPPGLRLSITSLPAWLDAGARRRAGRQRRSRAAGPCRAQPGGGLFEAALAESRRAFAARSPHPWRLAVPTARIAFDDAGAPLAVESEAPHRLAAVRQEEVVVTPRAVADLLGRLRRKPPPGLAEWSGSAPASARRSPRQVSPLCAPSRQNAPLRVPVSRCPDACSRRRRRSRRGEPWRGRRAAGVRVIGTDCRAADARPATA